ncbi:MAG: ABC transporter permease [Terracidiphilus sp.]
MQNLLQDISLAFRKLRHSPGFAMVAVLSLTMAIAANVVVFGVVNAFILHPLPLPDADRVVQIQGPRSDAISMSYPNYLDILDRNRSFSGIVATRLARIGFDASGAAQPLWAYEVSGNYFNTLGIKPLLGRFLQPSDDTAINGSSSVVLSYDCWKVRFGSDPHVIGRTVRLNKLPFVVTGVAPKSFNGTERLFWPELWVPIKDEPELEGYNWIQWRGSQNAWVVGRLKNGVAPAQADADLHAIAAQLSKQYPSEDKTFSLRVTQPGLAGDALGKPVHAFLFGVMLLAGLVLLAACANLGGLFAARTADRAREFGIRIAIGSSRARILRQLLIESVLVAITGACLAACAATLLLRILTQWQPVTEMPVQLLVAPDAMLYLFAVLLALATGVLFGVIPARQIWKSDPNDALKSGGSVEVVHHRLALRDVLLAVQIALCCLLVTASFVALRGLERTFAIPLGIHPEDVAMVETGVQLAGYHSAGVPGVQQRLLNAVSQIPGVEDAAYANSVPLSMNQSHNVTYAPGTTDFSLANARFVDVHYEVSPGYFQTVGTPLLVGRTFTSDDDADSPKVAIVNQTFAKRLFGTEDVVGKRFPTGPGKETEIVGVVADGKYSSVTEDPAPAIFLPILQNPNDDTVLLVRSKRSFSELAPEIRKAVIGVDPALPIFSLDSWNDMLGVVLFPARAATVALGMLGALAMMLAVTGIFGLASYTVTRRMHELGIRIALGAQKMHILRTALGRTALLLGIGSLAGLVLGAGASRILASIVYQASASDPSVLLAAIGTMALVGIVSTALPARRAVTVNTAQLLRDE